LVAGFMGKANLLGIAIVARHGSTASS